MNRTLPLLLALLTTLAGCAEEPDAAAVADDADTADAGGNATAAPTAPPVLELSGPDGPLRNATWTLAGSVDRSVVLTVVLVDGDERTEVFAGDADGAFSVELDVPLGHSTVEATADDGTTARNATLALVREAGGEMEVRFKGDLTRDPIDDAFWHDIDGFPSRSAYEGCDVQHPGYATVHDAMLSWQAATGTEVTYSDCGQFGVGVNAIDGYESPGFWCFEVNGEAAEVGISLAAWAPGDVVTWDDCTIVL